MRCPSLITDHGDVIRCTQVCTHVCRFVDLPIIVSRGAAVATGGEAKGCSQHDGSCGESIAHRCCMCVHTQQKTGGGGLVTVILLSLLQKPRYSTEPGTCKNPRKSSCPGLPRKQKQSFCFDWETQLENAFRNPASKSSATN